MQALKVAVVIPCYRVTRHILSVLGAIGPEVSSIYVVDDACPDASGDYVSEHCDDARVRVVRNAENKGVGGAVMEGYKVAIAEGADVLVKIDGDGQMNPALIPMFVQPIASGVADYTKGNRFFNLDNIDAMPRIRIFGNAVLSFMNKLSSGYWDIFDPTNGYTAIHARVAQCLPLDKISRRYFFESDMLFRLNLLRAVVVDVPMDACYGDEVSHLSNRRVVPEFLYKHLRNGIKRIFYNYYLRDLSLASIELPIGIALSLFGCCYGAYHWLQSLFYGEPASAGTVMLSALPLLVGIQFVLAFIGYDIASVPRRPLYLRLRNWL